MKLTLERVLVGILLLIVGGVVVHAPLTVWLGSLWPDYAPYIKAWKELLMGVALVLLIVLAARRKKVNELLDDRLMQLPLVYAGLHFVLLALNHKNWGAVGAGLLIDLRYVLFFVLVYGTIKLAPQYRRVFLWVIAGGAAVVMTFAVLQMFVLPKDILTHIGYSKDTIAPYLTVDENPAYIRINSTLRGPNPLGAYAVIVISLLAAVALKWRVNGRGWVLAGLAALAAGLTLGASYSRSSVVGALAALLVVVVLALSVKARKRLGVVVGILTVLLIAGFVALQDTPVISNLVLHDNPTTGAAIDSNAGHVTSIVDGVVMTTHLPFGAGIGSTGSASLNTSDPIIIENQYLLIAHETGWLGLALFAGLYIVVMRRLWLRRTSVLALGTFGAGIGLAVIGLLLPVWADDTVSIVWWGLAALAAGGEFEHRKTRTKHARKKH
jgi:hypothetical protein